MDLDRSTIEINPCMQLNDMHMVLQNAKKNSDTWFQNAFQNSNGSRAHFLKILKHIQVFYIPWCGTLFDWRFMYKVTYVCLLLLKQDKL